MLLKYFYDKSLAHASYMVGCQKSGEALIVDPGRDIQPYIDAADAEGLRIVAATETHIHADFVSGSRELAERLGAKLYLSDAGPSDWKYQFAARYESRLVKAGDSIHVGRVRLEVIHTPGHTPESISFLLTDEGGGANEPMGIFTGDFVFVGSIGRPDLLETAAGVRGSAESGARQLFYSAQQFKLLPDHLQVWPAHGAGSACGKGLGAIPSSTVGYEKRFNPALQYDDEQAFVDYILADQPETPKYFAVMKRVNKEGPALLANLGRTAVMDSANFHEVTDGKQVIDTSAAERFGLAHAPATINLPVGQLGPWAGWLVDYDQPLFVIAAADERDAVIRILRSIGVDHIAGVFDSDSMQQQGLLTQSYRASSPDELRAEIERGEMNLVDVRARTEWDNGHIAQAQHFFLGTLLQNAGRLDAGKPVVTQCQSGGRSAIAASILQARGLEVINMNGGLTAWNEAGFPIVHEEPVMTS